MGAGSLPLQESLPFVATKKSTEEGRVLVLLVSVWVVVELAELVEAVELETFVEECEEVDELLLVSDVCTRN